MKITIIYNPNSTGDSESNAQPVYDQLGKHSVDLLPTKSAGHAELLAQKIAKKIEKHMIISSSGDGGYHEVINGILSVENHDNIIAGLLPSGNANDHYNAVHKGDLISRIDSSDVQFIDVLKLTTNNLQRYAHSYIGFGISSQIGTELNKQKLNIFNEVWIVVSQFFSTKPIRISYDEKKLKYSSLVFSNVERMAKILTLSQKAKTDDGLFEISTTPANSFISAIGILAKAAVSSLEEDNKKNNITFTIRQDTSVQLDGEVYQLKKGQIVTIESVHNALGCII